MIGAKKKEKKYNYKDDLIIQTNQELDIDFLEYDLHDIPFFKINRKYYFGGVKKEVLVPVSMPHRVIVEANPPRQGYSHLTWNTLNAYYLQKSMSE